ncbi:MAG: ATP-binding cassette domain-containing protein, partial [Fimbriimonadales bacterium]|nr:ATP-binding cassette domain-containing protein [Fimbriimonadales bacterium]
DNLAYGKPNATQEEIENAARMSHASEFIENLPEKYETKLGERGARLSGGEMQRVAIARALLVDPTLLILDEATSSLDPVSERKVQSALDEVMHSRTTLLIAHRLNTAARADKIVVLNKGQIVEMGSHDELVAKNGTYAGMFRAFSTGVFDGEL